MAVVSQKITTPVERVIELRTAGDEPVELCARRDKEFPGILPAEAPSQSITLTAKVGRFGDPRREATLLGDLADRLKQLAGVPWAPIR